MKLPKKGTHAESQAGSPLANVPVKARIAVLAVLLCAIVAISFAACSASQDDKALDADSVDNAATAESQAVEQDSYIAHGTEYGKSETVKVTTDLKGNVTAMAVEEWIKNPKEKKTIKDVSDLENIVVDGDLEDVSFTQDGKKLAWKTGGQDVTYTGTIDKELPFEIGYSYKLDGKKVDPSELQGVSGKLEVKLTYKNKTSGTYNYKGYNYNVQVPFVMASLVAFDPEHAINVEVDNGTVLDMNGNVLAVGLGMPGLGKTMGLSDTVDIPESATITADVKGFDMPAITTMVTSQAADMLAGNTSDLENQIGLAFSNISKLETGLGKLAEANKGLSKGLGAISEGADAMASNLPNTKTGLGNFANAASGIASMAGSAGSDAQSAVSNDDAALTAIDKLLDESSEGYENLSDAQISALKSARESIASAKSSASAAAGKLSGGDNSISAAATGLSGGLTAVSEGFTQVIAGAEGLSTALGQMKKASSGLAKGTSSMSDGISDMLSSIQSSIYGKINTLNAMSLFAKEQGAFGGSSSKMSATTMYSITAKA